MAVFLHIKGCSEVDLKLQVSRKNQTKVTEHHFRIVHGLS